MYGKEQIVVKKYNRDAAVILSPEEYESLIDPMKRLSRMEWNERFKKLDSIRVKIPDIDYEEVEREVAKAIKEVRAEKRSKS
jgi:PHD/YefM family antitoxin component YafN of YafNO toxin-antitoxin module